MGVVSHQTLTMIFPGRASFIMTHVLRRGLGWGWGLAMALLANGQGPFPLTLARAYTPPPTVRSRPPGGPLPSPADRLAPRFWVSTLSSRTSRFLLYELGTTVVPPSEGRCEEGVGSGGADVGPGWGARNHSLPGMDRPAAPARLTGPPPSTVTPLWFCVLAIDISTWWGAPKDTNES